MPLQSATLGWVFFSFSYVSPNIPYTYTHTHIHTSGEYPVRPELLDDLSGAILHKGRIIGDRLRGADPGKGDQEYFAAENEIPYYLRLVGDLNGEANGKEIQTHKEAFEVGLTFDVPKVDGASKEEEV